MIKRGMENNVDRGIFLIMEGKHIPPSVELFSS